MATPRKTVSIKVTPAMHKALLLAAKQDDRTLADWVRHCACYGLDNPEDIRRTRCKDSFQVLDHGRPAQ